MDWERRRLRYLEAMGIPVWVPRYLTPGSKTLGTEDTECAPQEQQVARTPSVDRLTAEAKSSSTPTVGLDWEALETCVGNCTACVLHRTRRQTVFGVGNRTAAWLVIGEAPGEQEDLKGEPFVGRAGQLLNEMLRAIGLSRADVYIANVLKCRPPKNRDPTADEAAACEAFLKRQVALISPQIILAAGRIAAQHLLRTTTPIGKLRGTVYRYQDIPLVVTYHPAYLLRSPGEKRRAWDDLRLAVRTFRAEKP
jgi:DNA polymerase